MFLIGHGSQTHLPAATESVRGPSPVSAGGGLAEVAGLAGEGATGASILYNYLEFG